MKGKYKAIAIFNKVVINFHGIDNFNFGIKPPIK